jgi:hypothetical protein
MKIELKNVKHSDFASRETNCFEASVYIDGKRAGNVSNDGRGGPHSYDSREMVEVLMEYAKTQPTRTWTLNGEKLEVPPTIDTVIDHLLIDHLYSRDLKRAMSKRILFVDKDGILKETITFKKDDLTALLRSTNIKDRLKTDKILNLMPFDAALSTYRNTIAAGV